MNITCRRDGHMRSSGRDYATLSCTKDTITRLYFMDDSSMKDPYLALRKCSHRVWHHGTLRYFNTCFADTLVVHLNIMAFSPRRLHCLWPCMLQHCYIPLTTHSHCLSLEL